MGLRAVCVLTGHIMGFIFFNQESADQPTIITGEIRGLEPVGAHGFHVHALGDLTDGCKSTGTHYNPHQMTHGAPHASVRHAGDLGNIVADSKGMVNLKIQDSEVQLFGEFSVLGRAIVVHEKIDDLGLGGDEESKKTGNAGARIGCCIIGIANPDGLMATLPPPLPAKA